MRKVRHIYDVVKLFSDIEVQDLLFNKPKLIELLNITKQTDLFYISKRKNHKEHYNPNSNYDFDKWFNKFANEDIRKEYESLHINLIYTEEVQDFDKAIKVFQEINAIFKSINN